MASPDNSPNLSQVCQGPVSWRVQSASRVIADSSAKEAATVLRTLVQSVFGAAGPAEPGVLGWGLQIFTRSQHPSEYQQLVGFLSSQGPLVSMALRHAQDPFMLFEFPVAWLPASSQSRIAEGAALPLYAGKIHNPGPGKTPHTLLLNSFEYYMHHFCYYLVHVGELGGNLAWTCVGDSVYPSLLEDYLVSFLPCDGAAPLPPPAPLHYGSPSAQLAARLASSGLQQLTSLISPATTNPATHPAHTNTAFTSQTVAQVLVEMLINQCQPVTWSPASSPPRQQQHALSYTQTVGCTGVLDITPPEYRPSYLLQPPPLGISSSIMTEHIRAVRMIIKHFHFFSNSTKPAQPSPLDGLRRSLWPMCRKSFYELFLQLLLRWPLDSSFRLLLEAWLSFIQPWRYMHINRPAGDGAEIAVQWSWQRFVADNLLFYSGILAAVLPRLLRLDLSAARNAHMLYRICKVLSLPNLSTILQSTEEALHSSPHSLASPAPPGWEEAGRMTPHEVAMAARAHLVDFEGANCAYLPVFGQHSYNLVCELLGNIRSAEAAVQSELEANKPKNKDDSKQRSGVLGAVSAVVAWFDASSSPVDTQHEELQITSRHLNMAGQQLQQLFQVSDSSVLQHSLNSNESPTKRGPAVPDQVNTPNGPVLSDQGRRQLVSGLRRKDIQYEGDPDLRPIALGEFAALVRWLYTAATFLNTKYHEELLRGYHSPGVWGALWRCVLQPPRVVLEYDKQKYSNGVAANTSAASVNCGVSYPVRRARHLPPRLSFRKAANRQLVVSLLVCCSLLRLVLGLSLWWQLAYIAVPALLLFCPLQLLLAPALMRAPQPS